MKLDTKLTWSNTEISIRELICFYYEGKVKGNDLCLINGSKKFVNEILRMIKKV